MTKKMKEAMHKLKKVSISIDTHVHCNMNLLYQAYFGCGIIRLMQNQEKELMKISENILLKKMELSAKLSRRILCARKLALGLA